MGFRVEFFFRAKEDFPLKAIMDFRGALFFWSSTSELGTDEGMELGGTETAGEVFLLWMGEGP